MSVEILHLAQQAINAVQVSAFYALLAVAYVLLHGVSNRFNLSFGAVATWSGYVALGLGISLFNNTFLETPAILAAALAGSLLAGGALGLVIGRSIIAPVMNAPSLAALVATVGLAIALEETMRIATGGADFWLHPLYAAPVIEIAHPDYPIRISLMQTLVLASSLGVAGLIALLMRHSRFGREWRACADDPHMLALVGVNVRRLVALSSVASCLTAATTGFLIAVHYGNISFTNGFILAMKALFVAIVGGLSSFRGAIIGGFVVGFAETAWSAFFPLDYRDVATFVALTAIVVLGRRTQLVP